MKLSKRQTKIIVIFFLAILIISISFIAIKSISKGEEKKKVSIQPNPNEEIPDKNEDEEENNHENDPTNPPPINNNLDLESVRKANINSIEKLLTTNNIKEQDLLQRLKNDGKLNASKNDWRNYFNSVTKISELSVRWTIASNLINNISNEQNPSPPTNKWEKILWEIERFMDTNPTTLQKIKDWVNSQNYPDPLAGVDLKGAGIDALKKLPDSGKIPGLDKVSNTNPSFSYRDYVQLSAAGDGNCFLNSFSVFLTGKNRDTSLALPLRVKTCLEFMTNPDKFIGGTETQRLVELKLRLMGDSKNGGFAKNGDWLENFDIVWLSPILKRNITLISVVPDADRFSDKDKYSVANSENLLSAGTGFTAAYPDRWVVYNSGGHFQPLIKK